jgi:hypothetical protein
MEMIEAKVFRLCIIIYSLFKSERLSTNIKLTLHKALIMEIMTYACPAWEFAADSHLTKIAVPAKQSSPHHWKFSRRTPVRDFNMAFKLPYIYDYITKLCR